MKKSIKKDGRSCSTSRGKGWKQVIKKKLKTKPRDRHASPSTAMKQVATPMKAHPKSASATKAVQQTNGKRRRALLRCAKTMKKMLEKRRKTANQVPSTPMKSMKKAPDFTPLRKVKKPMTPTKSMKKAVASTPRKTMKKALLKASSGSSSVTARKLGKRNPAQSSPKARAADDKQKPFSASRGSGDKARSRLLLLGDKSKATGSKKGWMWDYESSLSSRKPQKFANAAEALRAYLMNPAGVTSEPAAFQLRCTQRHAEGGPRTVVVVVGGRCRLWKLNQVVAECFDVSEEEFAFEPLKGRCALGSRFVVTRSQEPFKCSSALICCRKSAIIGGQVACVDDRNHTVAELFRGKSTRDALERHPSDMAQRVIFMSPSLDAEVVVSLDGIMCDSYDSHTLFENPRKPSQKKRPPLDKMRRHSNGRRPLPRIVRSSFLSIAEIEAKNICMQGSRDGPDFLLRIATPWSALHESCRRSQRKPLFRKDGRDFDVNDLCHVNRDVESEDENEE